MINYLDDALILLGLVLVAWGCWLIYPPLAFLVGGLILLLMGLLAAWRRGN